MATTDLAMDPPGPLAGPSKQRKLLRYREPFPLSVAMQALAIFAGVGASIGLFVATLGLHQGVLNDFLGNNYMAAAMRTALSLGFVVGAGLGGGGALVFLAIFRRRAVPGLRRAADLAFPLAVAFLLPS